MTVVQHPWQNGPVELISHAIDHLHLDTDFDRRLAFLLLDVGVETVLKTFLLLPQRVTKTQMGYQKRKEKAEGTFNDLIDGTLEAAGARLQGFDLNHVQFYHDVRNKLYHQGNGVTVSSEEVKSYATWAVSLLRTLLGADLSAELNSPETELVLQARLDAKIAEWEQKDAERKGLVEDLLQAVRCAVERIEPRLVLPSFLPKFETAFRRYEKTEYADDGSDYVVVKVNVDQLPDLADTISELIDRSIGDPSLRAKLKARVCMRQEGGELWIASLLHSLWWDDLTPDALCLAVAEVTIAEDDDWWLDAVFHTDGLSYALGPSADPDDRITSLDSSIKDMSRRMTGVRQIRATVSSWLGESA